MEAVSVQLNARILITLGTYIPSPMSVMYSSGCHTGRNAVDKAVSVRLNAKILITLCTYTLSPMSGSFQQLAGIITILSFISRKE